MISVVTPVYNEEKTLVELFNRTKLIFEKQILESLMNSIYVGVVTVICSVVIGFYFANYYHTSKSKMKEFLQFIIFLPFLLPPIITLNKFFLGMLYCSSITLLKLF